MPDRLASLPSVSEGSFDFRGTELAYEVHGSGPRVLVYLHGLLLDSNLNRRLAASLAETKNRVVLLDLPGHGRSEKPRHASAHRMDSYAECAIALLDHLEVETAVIGGLSLGANVALECAVIAPERVQGLLIEMPVLEMAVPGAGLIFLPLLLGIHYASGFFRFVSKVNRSVPQSSSWTLQGLRAPLRLQPEESAAILHGLFVGPITPTVEQRRAMTAPALVIGHRLDFLHPFSDAQSLVEQIPNARLVQASSIAELRFFPERLTAEISDFLDYAWSISAGARRQGRQ